MNIFYLDSDIDKCAEAHIDRHVLKMQLETAQMLCTNLWIDEVLGYIPRKVTSDEVSEIRSAAQAADYPTSVRYKPCFYNHPCTIWMRQSYENYEYSVLLVDALNSEARWRGFNEHKSFKTVQNLPLPKRLPSKEFLSPAQAMPDKYKRDSAILAYRLYYRGEKAGIASWTRRDPPSWWWRDSDKNYLDAKMLRDRSRGPNREIWQKQMNEIIRIGS